MSANLGAWIRPTIPRLPCLSKSPVNWNDCPADWKDPAPFSLALRPLACLRISHALFSVLSSIAECTTPLITFLFDFTAGSRLCLAQTLWAVKSKLLGSLARHPRSLTFLLFALIVPVVCASKSYGSSVLSFRCSQSAVVTAVFSSVYAKAFRGGGGLNVPRAGCVSVAVRWWSNLVKSEA